MRLASLFIILLLGMESSFVRATPPTSHRSDRLELQTLQTLNSEDYDKVIRVARETVVKEPQFIEVYELLARASGKKGILEDSITFLKAELSRRPNHPGLLYGLALCHHHKKDYDEAAQYLFRALQSYPRSQKPYVFLAHVFRAKGDLNPALKRLHRLEKSSPHPYPIYFGLATAYRLNLDFQQALEYADKTIKINPKDPLAHLLKAAILWDLHKLRDYLSTSKQAEDLAEKTGNHELMAEAYTYVGRGHGLLGDFRSAFQYLERSLHLSEALGDPQLQGFAFYLKAVFSSRLDKTAEAAKYFQSAERLSLAANDKERQAWTALKAGELAWQKLNDYSKAADQFLKALDLFKEIHDDVGASNTYRGLGEMAALIGEYDKAIDLYKQALRLVRSPSRAREAILGSLGDAFLFKEDYQAALEFYNQALALSQKDEASLNLNVVYWNIAKTYMKMGLYKKALDTFDIALRLARARKRPQFEGLCLKGIGDASLRLQKFTQAEQSYQAALTMGRSLGYEDLQWEAYEGLGDLSQQKGDDELAYQYYRNAVELIEAVRKRLTPKERTGFSETNMKAYHTLVELLLTLHRKTHREDYAELAFYYAEKAKASNILDLMRRGHLTDKVHLDDSLKRRMDETQDALHAIHQQLIAMNTERKSQVARYDLTLAEKTNRQIADLELDVRRLDNRKAALLAEMKKQHPGFSFFYDPAILNPSQIQSQLNETETLLEYLVTDRKIIAFIVGKKFFRIEEIPVAEKQLKTLVEETSTLFTNNRQRVKDPVGAGFHLNELQTLYKAVFQPLEKFVAAGTRLIIVPDGLLSYVPFEMLVTGFDNYKPCYLLKRYPISYSYAASLLGPKRGHSESTRQIPLLAMGNPDFTLAGTRSQDAVGASRVEHLASLPYSEAEVRNIRRLVPGGLLFLKGEATEHTFKQLASKSKVIHLATHNILDDQNPLYSRIAFTLNPTADQKGEDGYLYLYETLSLDLHADLVILSACDTASGHLRRGEALDTMSRAFLSAGVDSVVATLWPIADSPATVDLMTRFYKHMAEGAPKREALRKAKLELIARGKYDDPFFWAPFILIGNADPISLDDSHFRIDKLYWAMLASIFLAALSGFLFLHKKAKKEQLAKS
ncbi:MAG: CHAT domain-containing protein [Acidobacteria bacterium]|nr:CHAT domain-containing protein [Acidobacteriota bacterium]MBI3655531.1 CHAT domain-containing protein [Acidobacteriota bacterium]